MKTMRTIAGLLFAVLIAVPCAAEEGKTAAAKSVDKAIAAFEKETAAFREKVMAAPAEKRRELSKEGPDAGPVIKQVIGFLKESPQDAGVPAAAGWLMAQRTAAVDRAAIYGSLIEHHLESPDLGQACLATLYDSGDAVEPFLESVFKKAGEAQAKAAAAYVLSYKLRRAGEDQQEKRVEYLRAVVEHAGDLEFRGRSIKAAAEGELFAAENLGIGKEAPEIEGEDTAGEAFKLSDYRGKVVVIDFWGDW